MAVYAVLDVLVRVYLSEVGHAVGAADTLGGIVEGVTDFILSVSATTPHVPHAVIVVNSAETAFLEAVIVALSFLLAVNSH